MIPFDELMSALDRHKQRKIAEETPPVTAQAEVAAARPDRVRGEPTSEEVAFDDVIED